MSGRNREVELETFLVNEDEESLPAALRPSSSHAFSSSSSIINQILNHKHFPRPRNLLLIIVAVIIVIAVVLLSSEIFTHSPSFNEAPKNSYSLNPKQLEELAKDFSSDLNTSVNPCDDFYQYACGGWLAKNPLPPPDKPYFAKSFTSIAERNEELIIQILHDGYPKITSFFNLCMDQNLTNSRKLQPLLPLFNKIDKLNFTNDNDKKNLFKVIADLQLYGFGIFWDLDPISDPTNPEYLIADISQGGMGLPSKLYYNESVNSTATQREQYKVYVSTLFELLGSDKGQSQNKMENFFEIEQKISLKAKLPEELRDLEEIFKVKMDINSFGVSRNWSHEVTEAWQVYWTNMLGPKLPSVIVNVEVVEFIEGVNDLIFSSKKEEYENIKDYLKLHVVFSMIPFLPQSFGDANFAYKQKLTGVKEQPTLEKRCVTLTQNYLGFLIGHLFTDRTFSKVSKDYMTKLITNLMDNFSTSLSTLTWMDKETSKAAQTKLSAINPKIGYPKEWPVYDEIPFYKDKIFESGLALRSGLRAIHLAKISKKIDKLEWEMYPQEVNAYYRSDLNEIVFPAGILQSPFFNLSYLNSMNYGAIGSVIGHELTHGFDDNGRLFDEKGMMRDWWTNSTSKEFDDKTKCVSDFYSNQFQGVNGKLTLGENIADMGGVKMAWNSWKTAGEYYSDGVISKAFKSYVKGMTSEKIFWIVYAQNWCTVYSPDYLQYLMNVDPHAPGYARVNGPLMNSKEWQDVWKCKKGHKMYTENKCSVW